jgi:hypothetical protein
MSVEGVKISEWQVTPRTENIVPNTLALHNVHHVIMHCCCSEAMRFV